MPSAIQVSFSASTRWSSDKNGIGPTKIKPAPNYAQSYYYYY